MIYIITYDFTANEDSGSAIGDLVVWCCSCCKSFPGASCSPQPEPPADSYKVFKRYFSGGLYIIGAVSGSVTKVIISAMVAGEIYIE